MNSISQSETSKVTAPFDARRVVDVDSHYSEPHDLWTKRAPQKFKDRVPRVASVSGKQLWVIDENHPLGMNASPGSTVLKDGTKLRGLDFMRLSHKDVHAGCYDAKARVALMDQLGISAQLIYANVLGFGGLASGKIDSELRLLSTKIFNDAMAELQEESDQRIFPMALLPWWDVKEAVAEVQRTHEMGLHGININPEPHGAYVGSAEPIPDLSETYWHPLWEICEALDQPVNFHVGASNVALDFASKKPWPKLSEISNYVVTSSLVFMDNATTMANIVLSGLLDRFPKLKLVSVESGLGWVPFLMEALDYQFKEAGEKGNLRRPPSEYIKTNIYTAFWFERRLLTEHIRAIGVDNVMFETDFPHPTCLYPIDDVAGAFKGLTGPEIDKVLSGNAIRVYNLPL
jgi:predicted TIM-barrel fold metal-dependent hydrolase